jgi:hypothetical protein
MKIIVCKSKEDFYKEIKDSTFCEDFEIRLEQKKEIVFLVHCNDAIIRLTGRAKDASYVTENIERETGESVPINEIINWFETKF